MAACRAEAEACLKDAAVHVTDSVRLAAQGALAFAALSEGRPEEAPRLLPSSPTGVGGTALGGRGSLAVFDMIEAAYRTFEAPRARQMLDLWRGSGPQGWRTGSCRPASPPRTSACCTPAGRVFPDSGCRGSGCVTASLAAVTCWSRPPDGVQRPQ
ncbi:MULTISPECIES: hypothetical protein [Streptomyces]|uniref:hypothetical protein n=1 Tax=Streptomyces TaxID=1883 RepID=UPI001E2B845E|nr:hypothetical protein [Streptomyces canarius]